MEDRIKKDLAKANKQGQQLIQQLRYLERSVLQTKEQILKINGCCDALEALLKEEKPEVADASEKQTEDN